MNICYNTCTLYINVHVTPHTSLELGAVERDGEAVERRAGARVRDAEVNLERSRVDGGGGAPAV